MKKITETRIKKGKKEGERVIRERKERREGERQYRCARRPPAP